jgi:hypothetical protein
MFQVQQNSFGDENSPLKMLATRSYKTFGNQLPDHMGLQQRSPYLFGKYLFKPGDLLSQCGCFVVSLGLSRKVAGFKLKLSYGHFLPHRFQCAIYDERVI